MHQRPQCVLPTETETASERVDETTFASLQDGTLVTVSDLLWCTKVLQDCRWRVTKM